jgi:hypothetical protein
MSEENESGNVNDSMVNDFFGNYELIDQDSGEPISREPKEPVQEPQQPQTNATQAKTPEQQQVAPQQSFDQSFYDENNGQKVFNAAKAFDFVRNQSPVQTSDTLQSVFSPTQQSAQQQQAQVTPPDTRAPWEIELEEENKLRETYVKQHTSYKSFLQQAISQGYNGEDAFRVADQMAQEQADMEFRRASYEKRYKMQEEAKARDAEAKRNAEIEPMSRVNIAKVSSEFGGHDKFNAFLFGVPDASGKLVNGYGMQTIGMLFDLAHEGQNIPKEQLADKYKSWWTKFSSNENNLRFVVNQAKANLQLALHPQMVDKIHSVANKNQQQVNVAGHGRMSPVSKNNGGQQMSSTMQEYLRPQFDTV